MKEPKLTIPFYIFNYLFNEQIGLSIPLIDKDAVFINGVITDIKEQFKVHIAKTVLKEDQLETLIPYYKKDQFVSEQLIYQINAATDGIGYPELSIPINYFSYESDKGFWATIPHLDIEAFGETKFELKDNLIETIDLYLESFQESGIVQELLPLIWNAAPELKKYTIEVPITPSNKEKNNPSFEHTIFLKKIGHPIRLKKQVAYGQDPLVAQIIQSLRTATHKNILLTGPSQSGKTAIIWQVIYKLQKRKNAPTFVETTAASLIRELSNDQNWKVNIKSLIEEVNTGKYILYIRNWMEMFEVGKSIENDISLGEYLYRFVETEKLHIITECTDNQLAKIEIIKPGYQQFFQVIKNPLLTGKHLQEVVLAKVKSIARSKSISIKEEAIHEVIRLNKRFAPYAGMPGKAIRFLERIIHNHYLQQNKSSEKRHWITKDYIIRAFSEESGIPLLITDPNRPFNPSLIEEDFKKQLFGQDDAIKTIVDMLAVVKSDMTNLNKPIGSFLFAGPTGVGKTELAKILSGFIFSNRKKMIRFDMSEYNSPHSIQKLVGTDHKIGLLAATIRKNPFCVLLFDEIEKAHSTFNDYLLQILGEGRLTDATGTEINFCSSIIVMTSNIGVERIMRTPVGFNNVHDNQHLKENLLKEIRNYFAPEVFNRIDYSIIFYPITEDITASIVARELGQLKKREGIKYRKTNIDISPKAIQLLAKKGFDIEFGARNIQRVIRKKVAIPLSKQLNQFDKEDHLNIQIDVNNDQIVIHTQDDPLSVELLIEEMLIADLASEASELRADTYTVLDSYIFNQVKGKEEFLLGKANKSHEEGKALVNILELTQGMQSLFDKTKKVETELSMAFLKMGNFRQKVEEDLAFYRKELAEKQLQILSTAFPEKNTHHLTFYGFRLAEIVPYYISALKAMGFKVKHKTIWHFPNTQLAYYKEQAEVHDDWEIKDNTFLITNKNKENLLKSATASGAQLVVKGQAIAYYLDSENNILEWNFPDGLKEKIIISSSGLEDLIIPHKINKLEFYKQKTPSLIVQQQTKKEPTIRDRSRQNPTPITISLQMNWQNSAAAKIGHEFY